MSFPDFAARNLWPFTSKDTQFGSLTFTFNAASFGR